MNFAHVAFGLLTTVGLGQTNVPGASYPITDGRQCGFRLTISSEAFQEARKSPPNLKEGAVPLFARLENLNDFPVRYVMHQSSLRLRVTLVQPERAWMPISQEAPLTAEEMAYRKGGLRYVTKGWQIEAHSVGSAVRDLREAYVLQPGRYKVTAYMLRPSPAGYPAQTHPTCPTPVWVQSNEIEIEVQK